MGVWRRTEVLRRSVRVLGLRFTVRTYAATLLSPRSEAYDDDLDFPIDHEGTASVPSTVGTEQLRAEAEGYQAARVDVVRHILGLVPVERTGAELWDLGSGKARLVLVAASMGFGRVVGVEYDSALHEIAVANLDRVRDRLPLGTSVELRCHSATEVPWPAGPGPLVVCLFNPFRGAVFDEVVASLEARVEAGGGPVWIVYINPVERARLDASPRFELTRDETVNPPAWTSLIYRSVT